MTRTACQFVPAALAVLLGSGCYLFHGAHGASPPPPSDAGGPSLRLDAGPPPAPVDAGPIAPGCAPRPIDVACTDTGNAAVPVGVPYDLPLYLAGVDACFCGDWIDCRAEVAPDGVVELSTYVCEDVPCDGCFPQLARTCRLPPLTEGVHHVLLNGRNVFDLTVSDAVPAIGPVDVCRSHPVDRFGCGWQWEPMRREVDQICFAGEAIAGEVIPVRVTDFCHPCGHAIGSCEVTRTAERIHVAPTSLPPVCDIDCAMECELVESECFIPPLEPGEYTVTLEGMPGSARLLVSPPGAIPRPGQACLSLPED